MASWSLPPTVPAGAPLPSTTVNTIINNEVFLYERPYFAGFDAHGTSLSNNVLTEIQMTGTYASGYGFFLSGGLVVVPFTGIYFVSGTVWAAAGSGTIDATISVNGNLGIVAARSLLNSGYTGVSASGVVSMQANQFLGLYTTQTSGSPILTAADLTGMSVFFLGSQ